MCVCNDSLRIPASGNGGGGDSEDPLAAGWLSACVLIKHGAAPLQGTEVAAASDAGFHSAWL